MRTLKHTGYHTYYIYHKFQKEQMEDMVWKDINVLLFMPQKLQKCSFYIFLLNPDTGC